MQELRKAMAPNSGKREKAKRSQIEAQEVAAIELRIAEVGAVGLTGAIHPLAFNYEITLLHKKAR